MRQIDATQKRFSALGTQHQAMSLIGIQIRRYATSLLQALGQYATTPGTVGRHHRHARRVRKGQRSVRSKTKSEFRAETGVAWLLTVITGRPIVPHAVGSLWTPGRNLVRPCGAVPDEMFCAPASSWAGKTLLARTRRKAAS